MSKVKLFFSLIIPFIIWLIYGAAQISNLSVLFIFTVTIIHFLFIVWNREIFEYLSGDVYTYGSVVFSINLIAFLWTLISGFIIASVFQILTPIQFVASNFAYAIFLLGLITSLAIPFLTNKNVKELPKASSQRKYEDV